MDEDQLSQLREYERLTSVPIQDAVGKAIDYWMAKQLVLLPVVGVTPEEIDHLSQLRKPPKKPSSSAKKYRPEEELLLK